MATPETALWSFQGWPPREQAAYGYLTTPWIPHAPQACAEPSSDIIQSARHPHDPIYVPFQSNHPHPIICE
jgi:hypothetical protein